MSPSQSQSTSQHRVKVVRVLCDGCERTVADVYCGHCAKGACKRCEQTLHSGADCAISDLAHCAALLALCQSCRTRPAQVCQVLLRTRTDFDVARIC